jgi:hypothetical protein
MSEGIPEFRHGLDQFMLLTSTATTPSHGQHKRIASGFPLCPEWHVLHVPLACVRIDRPHPASIHGLADDSGIQTNKGINVDYGANKSGTSEGREMRG